MRNKALEEFLRPKKSGSGKLLITNAIIKQKRYYALALAPIEAERTAQLVAYPIDQLFVPDL